MAKTEMTGRNVSRLIAAGLAVVVALAGRAEGGEAVDAPLSSGMTVRKAGPRSGASAEAFFNIEGKSNGQDGMYASFGVLDFRPAPPASPAGKVTGLKLTLAQSLARFSKDGAIAFFLATDATVAVGEGSPLKFDPAKPGGVGDQLKTLRPLGGTAFKKRETGQVDTISLTLEGETEAVVRARLNAGESVRIVVVPVDDDVAATYFGPKPKDPAQRPKLTIEVGPGTP